MGEATWRTWRLAQVSEAVEGAGDCKEGGGNHFRPGRGLKHRRDKEPCVPSPR